MLQKLKKWINRFIQKNLRKQFVLDFSLSEINEKLIYGNQESFSEFLKMFKNDYIDRLGKKDYKGAEIMRETIEGLISMYDRFYNVEEKSGTTKPIDVITKLQEKMVAEGKNIGQ